jgi:hypothetical protein
MRAGRVAAACAVAAVVGLGVGGCDDTSDYDTDYNDSTPSYNDQDDPPPAYNGGHHSYDYDDTPDGRFNPTPPQGPYSP